MNIIALGTTYKEVTKFCIRKILELNLPKLLITKVVGRERRREGERKGKGGVFKKEHDDECRMNFLR